MMIWLLLGFLWLVPQGQHIAMHSIAWFQGSVNSPPTGGNAPTNVSPPSISPSLPVVGQAETGSVGTWSQTPPPTSYNCQWKWGDTGASISGATNCGVYTPVSGDLGHTLLLAASATNSYGTSGIVSSSQTSAVGTPPTNSTLPTLSTSSPVVGTSLSLTHGSWTQSPSSYADQWIWGDTGASISGATATSYTPVSGDVGHTLAVKESATNSYGTSGVVTSSATNVVSATPPTTCPKGTGDPNDGCGGANINGSNKNATLLNGYSHTPSWNVAGVDYPVGYDTTTTLKTLPANSGSLPSGVSYNSGNGQISITGNNVTMSGWDISGAFVIVSGANDTITNFKAVGGATIQTTTGASNLTISNCQIDLQGTQGTIWGGAITYQGTGTMTVEYCALLNAGGDVIQFQNNPASLVLKWNYIHNAGLQSGAHGDYTQWLGGPYNDTTAYNTTLNDSGTTQGFMLEPDVGAPGSGSLGTASINNNTMIGLGGLSYFTAVTVGDLPSSPVPAYTNANNYFDPTGAFGYTPGGSRGGTDDGSTKTSYSNNVNMVNGSVYGD